MKVIYIHQYFVTPQEGGAVRSYHLAKGMVDAGIEVDMVTAHNAAEYDLKIIDGIRVHYLPVPYDHNFGFWKRSWAFLNFVRQAKKLLPKLPRPDLLYITSTPLTTGMIGLWAKRKLALPYIFEVRDLWPEAPIQVGAIKNKYFKQSLYQLEKRIYRHALNVVALSPGIKNYIQKCHPNAEIHLIPNFADLDFFRPVFHKEIDLLEQMGWKKDRLTISYAGAIGQVNALDELLYLAAAAQKTGKNWQFAIMGKGALLPQLQQKVKEWQLHNLKFVPFGNKEEVRKLLSLTDIAFVSFDHLPVLQTNSPNKFFDAIAMGKAIMVNHKGWIYEMVRSHRLGIYYPWQKTDKIIKELEAIDKDRNQLKAMQHRSRELAEQYFDKQTAIRNVLNTIDPLQYPQPKIDGIFTLTA